MTTSDTQTVAIIGCGYVGRAVGIALRARGWRVRATTTSAERLAALAADGFEPHQLVGSDRTALAALLADCSAAYLTLAPQRGGPSYRDVYQATAEALVDVLGETPVQRLIYTSSTSVYAQCDGAWVDETSPTEPATENSRVLLETEHLLLTALPPAVDVSVVRLGGIYGPGRRLADFATRFAGRQRDDGDAFLNLAHLDDIVVGLVGLLDTEHHGVLNLSGDQPTTRRAVYDPLLRRLELPPVQWTSPAHPNLGKRVRSQRIQQLLELHWQHPTYDPEGEA
ncbi:MAG TPA: SDR family oxidoreductase [Phycisphaerae bacterium]|nr:SDR family oxidoreductase [Phycisphaerae bacterium]